MKRLLVFLSLIVLSCDSESAWDCIQTAGDTVQTEFSVPDFTRVVVNRDIELTIAEGPDHLVSIETGANLLDDISAVVLNGQLRLTDNNSCNFVRDYGLTRIRIQAPNLTEIRNSSQFEIRSEGVLNYPDLVLTSEDFNEPGSFNVGDFKLELNSGNVQIVSNNLSFYRISGNIINLDIGFFSGAGRFEGADCIAQNVHIFHRGTNDMIVNPQLSITGELRSSGNVISLNQPDQVDVQEYYTGRLIFED